VLSAVVFDKDREIEKLGRIIEEMEQKNRGLLRMLD
jgi:hypothetical protein